MFPTIKTKHNIQLRQEGKGWGWWGGQELAPGETISVYVFLALPPIRERNFDTVIERAHVLRA